KKNVIIINTSRGALINSEALVEALKNKAVGGACLDVYEEETDLFYEDKSQTIIRDDVLLQLLSLPNVIVTSHQAFLTDEALTNIAQTTIENILDYFEHGKAVNEVTVI
ncbi:MAG TPA: 2-hydroxyacid dehydrogenase, partial [Candidatus Scybalocola faecipullorum]|nr:2-hydroxyacid dehydrogenase [Candidatus Scybalocola faecipullorum]